MKTIDEAVAALLNELSEKVIQQIRSLKLQELDALHFDLGVYVRNRLDLWLGNQQLIANAAGLPSHPDTASQQLLFRLKRFP